MKKIILTSILGLTGFSAASAASLALDFQPTGGTTAAGYTAFEFTTQTTFPHSVAYPDFGGITVTVDGANLESTPGDWRSIARNGLATDVRNDWIGVDGRNAAGGNPEATFTITVSGLPAGDYSWVSLLHDGGPGVSGGGQGNITGAIRTTFIDSTGITNGTNNISAENILEPTSDFTTNFTSSGADVSLTLGTTGAGTDAIFVFADSLTITSIPEPSAALLGMAGLLAFVRRRR